jgi:hypothetical protein
MNKQELINELNNGMDLSTFTAFAHLYNVDYKCVIETSIYEMIINVKNEYDLCSKINEIYKNMTCRNLNSGKLSLKELRDMFSVIYADIRFE